MGAHKLADIDSARRLHAYLMDLLGEVPGEGHGVVHGAAVWSNGPAAWIVLRINDDSPKSEIDFLLLNLARARADAIVTTGKILRQEPEVIHEPQGSYEVRAALREWRAGMGLQVPPRLVVLTSGRGLDPRHPAFAADVRPLIFCPAESAEAVRHTIGGAAIEVVGHQDSSLRAAVTYLGDAGCRRISIESGPSSSLRLYDPPGLVDELVLSIYQEPSIAKGVAGGAFLSPHRVEELLGPPHRVARSTEASGEWEFRHYRRRPT